MDKKEEVKEEIKVDINPGIRTIPEELIPPHYIEGEPFCEIDGKHVPYADAQIIFQERLVKREQKKLDSLKNNNKSV